MSSREEVIRVFLAENQENMGRVENDLLVLEKDPSDREAVARIFRAIHSLKGTCGFLGFAELERLAHAGENLLAALRDGSTGVTPAVVTMLLTLVDLVRQMLRNIEKDGAEGAVDSQPLVAALASLQKAAPAPAAPPPDPEAPAPPPDPKEAAPSLAAGSKVRVDVGLLDKLMNLVGELVLARNQVVKSAASQKDPAHLQSIQRLSQIIAELQEGVMKTRMQPIGGLWDRFPRMVRDIALECGKKVSLEMQGESTELDRTIIEAMADPLVHLLRNAVDHGVENPEKRRSAGKPEEGRILLRAFHEGGQVIVEFSDDGAGLNANLLRVKAIKARRLSAAQATKMSEREALNLIFLRGISTADKVTHLSGRGVGMDIVKSNIERIGGTIDVQTRRGVGTLFRIRMPLTLAIIPAMIVKSSGERFAIPQASVLELVRLDAEEPGANLESLHNALVYRLRGNLLPVVSLSHVLGLSEGTAAPSSFAGRQSAIAVLQTDDRPFGLIMDEVTDAEEIVVKPISGYLKELSVYAGATLLGDGRVALILDVMGLAHRAGVVREGREPGVTAPQPKAFAVPEYRLSLLLLQGKGDGRLAVPLPTVTRLEEFDRASVERAGGQEVVQYRGQIMPLVQLNALLPERRQRARDPETALVAPATGKLQVIVTDRDGRSVGLVVDRIIDIVEESVSAQRPASRKGISRCAVIRERVTEIVDLEEVLLGLELALPGGPETKDGHP